VREAPGCAAVVGVVDELEVLVVEVEVLVVVEVVRWVVVDPRVVVEVEVVVGEVVAEVVVPGTVGAAGGVVAGAVEVVGAGAVEVVGTVAVEDVAVTVAVLAGPRLVLVDVVLVEIAGAHEPVTASEPRLTLPEPTKPPLTSAASRSAGLVSPLGTRTPENAVA
jgi:hypothetical protein